MTLGVLGLTEATKISRGASNNDIITPQTVFMVGITIPHSVVVVVIILPHLACPEALIVLPSSPDNEMPEGGEAFEIATLSLASIDRGKG